MRCKLTFLLLIFLSGFVCADWITPVNYSYIYGGSSSDATKTIDGALGTGWVEDYREPSIDKNIQYDLGKTYNVSNFKLYAHNDDDETNPCRITNFRVCEIGGVTFQDADCGVNLIQDWSIPITDDFGWQSPSRSGYYETGRFVHIYGMHNRAGFYCLYNSAINNFNEVEVEVFQLNGYSCTDDVNCSSNICDNSICVDVTTTTTSTTTTITTTSTTTTLLYAPIAVSVWVNETSVVNGTIILANITVANTTNVLDTVWLVYNDFVVNVSAAVNGSNLVSFNTGDALYQVGQSIGNYSVSGVVNDSSGLSAQTYTDGEDLVYLNIFPLIDFVNYTPVDGYTKGEGTGTDTNVTIVSNGDNIENATLSLYEGDNYITDYFFDYGGVGLNELVNHTTIYSSSQSYYNWIVWACLSDDTCAYSSNTSFFITDIVPFNRDFFAPEPNEVINGDTNFTCHVGNASKEIRNMTLFIWNDEGLYNKTVDIFAPGIGVPWWIPPEPPYFRYDEDDTWGFNHTFSYNYSLPADTYQWRCDSCNYLDKCTDETETILFNNTLIVIPPATTTTSIMPNIRFNTGFRILGGRLRI